MTERLPCIIEIDLDTSRRGLASVIAEPLGDRTVLQRVVDAVRGTDSVDTPVLLVHRDQAERARDAFPDTEATWFVHDHPDIPDRDRLRRARLWGKEGWRGGIGDSYFFCESGNPRALREVCDANDWDDVIVVPAEAAFVDPSELDAIASYYLAERRGAPVYLSTAPPGIAGDVVTRRVLEATSDAGAALNRVFAFRLDDANADADQNRIYHHFDEEVTTFRGRFTVDSKDSLSRARELMASLPQSATARDVFRRASDPEFVAGARPEELIVELLSDLDGAWPPRSGVSSADPVMIDDRVWQQVLESLSLGDESLLTLGGGYSDPLADSRLERRIEEARAAGALGIHVETTGTRVDDVRARTLLMAEPDAITVDLSVTRGEELVAVRPGTPPFEGRVRGLERLLAAQRQLDTQRTFILVSVLLDERTAPFLDEFVDRWFSQVDRVLIRGVETAEGGVPASSLGCFAPPSRFACVRIQSQMRVEHTGIVPLCSRDPLAAAPAGDLRESTIPEVWTGAAFSRARQCHRDGAWNDVHHCGSCRSWFRFD